MGYTYEIHYKMGQDNLAADALSRMPSAKVLFLAISVIHANILDTIKASYSLDPFLLQVFKTVRTSSTVLAHILL